MTETSIKFQFSICLDWDAYQMLSRDAVELYKHGIPEFKEETVAGNTLPRISARRWHLNCETRWKPFLKGSGAIIEQRGTLVFGGQEFKEKTTTECANNQAVEWGDPRECLVATWRQSYEKAAIKCVNCCWDVRDESLKMTFYFGIIEVITFWFKWRYKYLFEVIHGVPRVFIIHPMAKNPYCISERWQILQTWCYAICVWLVV